MQISSHQTLAAWLERRGKVDAVAIVEEPEEAGDKAKCPPKQLTVDLGKGVRLEMVLIRAGEFLMGSPDSDKDASGVEMHRLAYLFGLSIMPVVTNLCPSPCALEKSSLRWGTQLERCLVCYGAVF